MQLSAEFVNNGSIQTSAYETRFNCRRAKYVSKINESLILLDTNLTMLNVMSDCKINLTKIQSLPKIDTPWKYAFFVDVTLMLMRL